MKLKNLILECSEILEDKFGIRLEKTKLFLYEDIQEFLGKTENSQAQSMFIPRNLSAHVPNNRLDLVLHEYHGHGLYCEHTGYGQRMVEDEQKFEKMAEEEIQQALILHEHLKPTFEGHALWTEDFLLTKIKKEDLLEKRLKELEKLIFQSHFNTDLKTQKDVYDRIKQFEQENGIYGLWYSLGFPRQFDKETLIEIAKEKLNSRFNNLTFLIHFGSKNPNGDIDLCAVLEDEIKVDEYEHSRTIDLSQFNYSNFLKRLSLFDIPITQPLLTGELVYGDDKKFQELRRKLKNQKPTQKAIKHLQERSKWCFNYALNCFNQHVEGSNALELTLNNLAYALSFQDLSKKYKQGSSVLVLDEVSNPLLNKIREYSKGEIIEKSGVNQLISEVKTHLF